MKLDLSFDDSRPITPRSWSGPPVIVSGHGCRITCRTLTEPEGREADLLERMYEAVQALHATGAQGVSDEPSEGYLRIHGGEPALYVRGGSQREVITTIGQALIRGTPELKQKIQALGITALVEW